MSQTQERQNRSIKRTLCIGLGGTGRDVLMRIRRLIIDRYGKLSELPILSFVHIDTDKSATQISGLRTGKTYRGEDILFRDAEKVTATMTSIDINNIVQGLEHRSAYERQGPYDHIGCWLPPQILKDLKAIEEGAKGIRPVGRLAFFHNYRKIKAAIETADKLTRGHDAILVKKGFIVEPGLNIFIVGSLCGGTGSGMFLDVAYTLRRMYGEKGAQMFSYLIISPDLYGNTPNMNANTYAALKELNYYTTPETEFKACYDPQNLEIVQEKRPPFDYVYLVSNQTANDYKITEKSKLANVIASKIILDFCSEVTPFLKEPKDNFLTHLLKSDEHPRPNVQRYLTFGLAALYFPRDLTVQTSLNLIRLKLLKFWLQGEGQNPDPKDLLERFLMQWQSDRSRKDIFTLKLEEVTQEGNKTFTQNLNNWRNNLENKILECTSKEEREEIIQQLPRTFREQFRTVQSGETESNRGMWLTNLQQNRSRITDKLQQDITHFLSELLNPNYPDFSLNSGRSWLEALLTELNSSQRNIEEKIQNLGGMHRLEDVERKWKDSEQRIEDIESQGRLFIFNKNKQNMSKFQDESKTGIGQVYTLIKHNFEVCLHKEGLEIVRDLQKYVQLLINQGSNFSVILNNLKNFYDKKESDLRQLKSDEMTGEAIFGEEDTDEYYHSLLPDNEGRSQLVSVSGKINEKVGLGESLVNFLIRDRLIDEEQLCKEIDETVDQIFASRSLNVVQSVIKRFMNTYSLCDREIRLKQIFLEAEPLLPLNLADSYFFDEPGKHLKLIGFKQTDELEVQQFKNLLIKDLGISDNVLKPTQTEDEIIIVNEYAGFPLRLIHGLEQMRQQYYRQHHFDCLLLHNDYSTLFTDIIPPEARKIEELQDIFYPCLALDILKYNPETNSYDFQYYDKLHDIYDIANLSYVWSEALEQLANLNDMANTLKIGLEEKINQLKAQPYLWEKEDLPKLRKFARKITDLPETDPNYPYKATAVGTRETLNTSAKEGIILRFLRRLEAEISYGQKQSPTQTIYALPQSEIINSINSTNHEQENMAKLEKLMDWYEQGKLTEEEFKAAKKKILNL